MLLKCQIILYIYIYLTYLFDIARLFISIYDYIIYIYFISIIIIDHCLSIYYHITVYYIYLFEL